MDFLSLKRFFPVIHCVNPFYGEGVYHTLINTKIALENSADGIFLIGHEIDKSALSFIYEQVRKEFPYIWIGINFLDVTNSVTLEGLVKRCSGLNGLWVDTLPNERLTVPKSVEIFGGVAFKYKDPDICGEELKKTCDKAKQVIDIVTTSGSKTGSPPDVKKLEEIRMNIGNETRLALASGVSSENVSSFLQTVSDFLVASSISGKKKYFSSYEYLIPEKVIDLAMKIHS